MQKRLRIFAERSNFGRYVDVRIATEESSDGSYAVASPLVFTQEPSDFSSRQYHEPALRLTKDDAQSLMDELWNCGLRPTEGSGSAGALAATQNHLKDMQRIVFKDFDK